MKSLKISSLVVFILFAFSILFVPTAHAASTKPVLGVDVTIESTTTSNIGEVKQEKNKLSDGTTVTFRYDQNHQTVSVYKNKELMRTFTIQELREIVNEKLTANSNLSSSLPSDSPFLNIQHLFPNKFDRTIKTMGNSCKNAFTVAQVINGVVWGAAGIITGGAGAFGGLLTGSVLTLGSMVC